MTDGNKDLRDAVRRRERLKQDVLAWMADQGKQGRLRCNGDAPMWRDYEAAVREVDRLTMELAR